MPQCAACHAAMEDKIGSIDLRVSGVLYFIRNVSYAECDVCSKRTISPEVSQLLFEKIKNKQYVEEVIKVFVLDCSVD